MVPSSSPSPSPPSSIVIWNNLIRWVTSSSSSLSSPGYVHPALRLTSDDSPSRGVIASRPIPKGELLIRIPPNCVLSGESLVSTSSLISSKSKRDEATTTATATATKIFESSSDWLKCLIAYYRAAASRSKQATHETKEENGNHYHDNESQYWKPYLDSLPVDNNDNTNNDNNNKNSSIDDDNDDSGYDTLLQWTDEEINTYLKGTTLGSILQTDRKEDTLQQRYRLAVRPKLQALGLIEKNDVDINNNNNNEKMIPATEWNNFKRASMCISTRGFHNIMNNHNNNHNNDDASTNDNNNDVAKKQQSPNENDNGNTNKDNKNNYPGPFLLPVIDLLNHDPARSCTTLHRSNNGSFTMVAERDIAQDEEIVHSYGNDMTSAQLLQTFGFCIPHHHDDNNNNNDDDDNGASSSVSITPVSLNKTRHVLAACERIKKTTATPSTTTIHRTYDDDDDGMTWDVSNIPTRSLSHDISDDMLVSINTTTTTTTNNNNNNNNTATTNNNDNDNNNDWMVLSDELVTLVVCQFLPLDAYQEVIVNDSDDTDGKLSAWLDISVLDDYFLGKLVCQSLSLAIDYKLREYITTDSSSTTTTTTTTIPEATVTTMTTNTPSSKLLSVKDVLEKDKKELQKIIRHERQQQQNDNDPPGAPTTTNTTSRHFRHASYGLTIRIEELTSLERLEVNVRLVQECLEKGQSVESIRNMSSSSTRLEEGPDLKRARLS